MVAEATYLGIVVIWLISLVVRAGGGRLSLAISVLF